MNLKTGENCYLFGEYIQKKIDYRIKQLKPYSRLLRKAVSQITANLFGKAGTQTKTSYGCKIKPFQITGYTLNIQFFCFVTLRIVQLNNCLI